MMCIIQLDSISHVGMHILHIQIPTKQYQQKKLFSQYRADLQRIIQIP